MIRAFTLLFILIASSLAQTIPLPDQSANYSRSEFQNPNGSYGVLQSDGYGNLNIAIPSENTGGKALSADRGAFGPLITATFIADIGVSFASDIPQTQVGILESGTTNSTHINAKGRIETSAINSSIVIETHDIVKYRPAFETVYFFTARFPVIPSSDAVIKIGPQLDSDKDFNVEEGFAIGYKGSQFGIFYNRLAIENFIPQNQFSEDTLVGAQGSYFRRDKLPEAINPQTGNVFRIRYGWLGFASPIFEVLSPDGNWVVFHQIKSANNFIIPHLVVPNLPLSAYVLSNSESETLAVETSSWAGGHFGRERENIIDPKSSTDTPLPAGGVFVGEAVDMINGKELLISINSDQDSVADGVIFEFSQDRVNWFADDTAFTYSANTLRTFNVGPVSRFFRIRYINGPTPQTSFRIQTILLSSPSRKRVTKLKSELSPEETAETVKASILLEDNINNTFKPAAASPSGSLQVAVTDRPSELRNRTRVVIPISRAALDATPTVYYNVTPGSTLYISSFLITALNSSTADGQFQLRDDTTVYVDFLVPSRVSGSSPSAFSVTAPTLPEPLPFINNLNFIEVTGAVDIAGYLIGYEEPN